MKAIRPSKTEGEASGPEDPEDSAGKTQDPAGTSYRGDKQKGKEKAGRVKEEISAKTDEKEAFNHAHPQVLQAEPQG